MDLVSQHTRLKRRVGKKLNFCGNRDLFGNFDGSLQVSLTTRYVYCNIIREHNWCLTKGSVVLE